MQSLILSAARTPVGKFLGGLAELPATRLGAAAVREALKRAGLEAGHVDEVILGQVVQAGCGQNPARQAALLAGLPPTIAALTVNKVCGSGLKAVMLADQVLRAGDADVIVAGGMESMSQAPYLLPGGRTGFKYGHAQALDALVQDGLWCAFENWPMGLAAEHTASTCGVTRGDQDRFALQSHQRAAAAWDAGHFAAEVFPVTIGEGAKARTISRDEGFRADASREGLAKLRPAFKPDGTVTAGNASQLSDGAAALVIASPRGAAKLPVKPLARIIASATSGVEPKDIFTAPVSAVQKVLAKAKLRLGDIDVFELNEAFAAQMLACGKQLGLDEAKVNVNGGAVALGHPIGASGARVLVTLLYALQRKKGRYGLASLCLGGGNAVAMIVESLGAVSDVPNPERLRHRQEREEKEDPAEPVLPGEVEAIGAGR